MPLDLDLFPIVLSNPCPDCGHVMKKTGAWFSRAQSCYTCPTCCKQVSMNYLDKIKVFDRHAQRKREDAFL